MTKIIFVWDRVVRLTHWMIAVLFFANQYAVIDAGSIWHRYFGYTILSLIAIRLLWGLSKYCPPEAKLKALIPSIKRTKEHFYELINRKENAGHSGHNGFGVWAIWMLWLGLLISGSIGYCMAEDIFGYENYDLLHQIHLQTNEYLLYFVYFHIFAAVATSLWFKRNLILNMIMRSK